jgi:hypothetical protein
MSRLILNVDEQRIFFFTRVIPLLRIGLSIKDISKILDRTTTTLRTYTRQYGNEFDLLNVCINGNKNRSTKNGRHLLTLTNIERYYIKIISLVQQGYRRREISQKLNINYFMVSGILKRKNDKKHLSLLLQAGLNYKEFIREKNQKELSKIGVSKAEIRLKNVISKYIPSVVSQYEIRGANKRLYYIDIAVLEHKIAFEYDGMYWHDPIRDQIRDENLQQVGWKTIRFRYVWPPTDKKMEEDFLKNIKELDLSYLLV